MNTLLQHPSFISDFASLSQVTLNPTRHTSANAKEHSLAVANEAVQIAKMNQCSEQEQRILEALGYLHDIGKISGSANADKSVDLLPKYEITDPALIALVSNHDTNLPWWISSQKGQAPSDKAWRKLSGKVDMRLLCLFMVADRVDCPGGWRANRPLVWFLAEAERRGLIKDLVLPVCEQEEPIERCAGGVLQREHNGDRELLVVKLRGEQYELPKGHIEPGESAQQATEREFLEETGIAVQARSLLGEIEYPLVDIVGKKQVQYFLCETTLGDIQPNEKIRWVSRSEIEGIPLVCEALRGILSQAFRE